MTGGIYGGLQPKTNGLDVGHTGPVTRTLIALLAAVSLGSVATAGAADQSQARLRIVRAQPLTLRGSGFEARERVRVVVFAGSIRQKVLHAGPAGGFTTSFTGVVVSFGRCGTGLFVSARGSAGSFAALKRPAPECPPSLDP
jgi:hypothetical protein